MVSTEAKLGFANTCENTAKKQLYHEKQEKIEISLDLAKTRLCIRICDLESLSLKH